MNGDDFKSDFSTPPTYKPDAHAREFVEKVFAQTPESDGTSKKQVASEDRIDSVSWRELIAVVLGVVLADWTIYRGEGFAGLAVFLFGMAVLFFFGAKQPSFSRRSALIFSCLILAAAKLVWNGFPGTAVAGFLVLFLFALVQTGRSLRFMDLMDYLIHTLFGGGSRINVYGRFLQNRLIRLPSSSLLSVFLPILALAVFGTVFVLANPSLVEMVRQFFNRIGDFISGFFDYLPSGLEVAFWCLAAWIFAGMFQLPSVLCDKLRQILDFERKSAMRETESARSPYYAAARNTLGTVILLFAVYLVFEFKTLWFRTFPEGFCYSDYSHQGAAWLVVALTLSTVVLSLVFQREMFAEPRIATLQKLAWIWSVLNFVLAVAIYNRLFLYISFNGMTRMRVVGLLGMTAVLVGFVMVVRKIAEQKDFVWLIRRFAWTVLILAFINSVLPVDWLIHRYNVSRIIQGDWAPSVQLSVHPIADEGYLTLLPLAQNCEDELIRDGIRAKLAQKLDRLDRSRNAPKNEGKFRWTRYQLAADCLYRQLNANREYLETQSEPADAVRRFDDYVYRWY